MKPLFYLIFFLFLTPVSGQTSSEFPPIYSKHWPGKLPVTEIEGNLLLIHDIFSIFYDSEKNLPVWVAYHLSPATVWGDLTPKRDYVPDPLLSEPVKTADYKGAYTCDRQKKKGQGYDKGHMAPLASFKGSVYSYQTQYLSNIVPQRSQLNQGPWRILEEQVRDFVEKGNEVKVLTGPIYGKEGVDKLPPCWKAAQTVFEEIPIAYWKVIAVEKESQIEVCSFLMPQAIKNKSVKPRKYQTSLKNIENKTGLSFFSKAEVANQKESCRFLN